MLQRGRVATQQGSHQVSVLALNPGPCNPGKAAHLGCMNTAKVLRAMPWASGPWAPCTKWGVACSRPPESTCIRQVELDCVLGDSSAESAQPAPPACSYQLPHIILQMRAL